MTKFALVLSLVVLLVKPVLAAQVDASALMTELESVLAQLEKAPDDAALLDRALELGGEALKSQGVAFHETTKEKFRVLQIDGGKAKLSRFAASVQSKLMGLKIYFNPGEIAGKGGVMGFYNTQDHTFSFAYHLQDVINLSNTTIHHELLHAVMTPRIYNDSNDTPYALFIHKKHLSDTDKYNPYAETYPTQELATHALDLHHLAGQLVRLGPNVDPAVREEILNKMMGKLVIVKLMSEETGEALVSVLTGLKDHTARFSNDPNDVGGGISKHFMIDNAEYVVMFPMPSTLDNAGVPKETIRRMISDVKFIQTYAEHVQTLAKAYKSKDLTAIAKAASELNGWARTALPAKLPKQMAAILKPSSSMSLHGPFGLPFFSCESLLSE